MFRQKMRHALGAATVLALMLWSQPASAAAILYYNDLSLGTDRMAEALTALSGTHTTTTATSPDDFATEIATGLYDLGIFFQQNSSGLDYDAAFAALALHIAGGGSAIADDWTQDDTHAAAFGAAFTGGFNQTQFTVTDPLLTPGIANPVDLVNPGWGTFSTGLDSGTAAAIFPNLEAAIIVANGGRTYFNGFLSDTFDDGAEGTQLYINEIGAALNPTAVPEPATLTLLGLGSLLAARNRRKNRS